MVADEPEVGEPGRGGADASAAAALYVSTFRTRRDGPARAGSKAERRAQLGLGGRGQAGQPLAVRLDDQHGPPADKTR